MLVTLEGRISRILSHDKATGKLLATLTVGSKAHTLCGFSLAATQGADVLAIGTFKQNSSLGPYFNADEVRVALASDAIGLIRYLVAHLTGLGPAKAEKLVDHFGNKTLDVLGGDPRSIADLPGFGLKSAEKYCLAWNEHKASLDSDKHISIHTFLHRHGLTSSKAKKVHSHYGPSTIKVLKENPYRLCSDLAGFGFITADAFALSLGVATDSSFRIKAGILHLLGAAMGQGSCGLSVDEVGRQGTDLLGIPGPAVNARLDELIEEKTLISDFSGNSFCVFLPYVHQTEQALAKAILRLKNSGPAQTDYKDVLAKVLTRLPFTPDDLQVQAVIMALSNPISVLSGPPGSGKTTIVKCVLECLKELGVKDVLLCAPTGNAAQRMQETTGHEAKTMHRALGVQGNRFKYNAGNPFRETAFICDEQSMTDIFLGRGFFEAVPTGARVLLVGDYDQIPSVGPGLVLADIMRSRAVPVTMLSTVHRQAEASAIRLNSLRVKNGQIPVEMEDKPDFVFIKETDPVRAHDTLIKQVRDTWMSGFDPIKDIQTLSPMRKGIIGTLHLNKELQRILNPFPPARMSRFGTCYAVNDKVMQTANNRQKELANGEVGYVAEATESGVVVDFRGRLVSYTLDEMDTLDLAYCMTVHKAQGSEAPVVVMPVMLSHFIMLQRNLLYTGITRARKKLIMIGDTKALWIAAKNDKTDDRFTKLADFLRAGTAERLVTQRALF